MINTQSVCNTILLILLLLPTGNDYDTEPHSFTIPAGMTSVVFNATIIRDDNLLEQDEIFYLTIDSSSLPNDITAGSPFQATVTIIDDDCK